MNRKDKNESKKSGWWRSVGRWWLIFVFIFLLGIVLLILDCDSGGAACVGIGLLQSLLIPLYLNPFSDDYIYKEASDKVSAIAATGIRRRQMVKRAVFTLFWMTLILLFVRLLGVVMMMNYEQTPYDPESLRMVWGTMALFTMLIAGTFYYVCSLLIRSRCTMGLGGRPDEDMVLRDGLCLIWADSFRLFLIPPFLIGMRCLIYLDRRENWLWVLTIALGILLAISFYRAIVLSVRLKRQNWELRPDELIQKDIYHDTTHHKHDHNKKYYRLQFQSKDTTWETTVSYFKYFAFQEGTYSWTVHIKGKKKPLFHYDVYGDAAKIR